MSRRNLTQDEFNKLKALAEELAYSPTKADGKQVLRKLEFYVSTLRGELFGDFNNTLGKLAAYAKSASGQVRDKAHWIDAMEEKLYILESLAGENRQGTGE